MFCGWESKQEPGAFGRVSAKVILEGIALLEKRYAERTEKNKDEWFEANKVFYIWSWRKLWGVKVEAKDFDHAMELYLRNDVDGLDEFSVCHLACSLPNNVANLKNAATKLMSVNGESAKMMVRHDLISQLPI